MAFTIGASDCTSTPKHVALRPRDLLVLLGRWERPSTARDKSARCARRVAECLAELPETYVVFNDYRPCFGRGRKWGVDHVVVGPSGVFVIETECTHRNRVEAASSSKTTAASVRRVQQLALEFRVAVHDWCGELGDVFVKPVLVFAEDGIFVDKVREGSVKVLPLRWLASEVTERSFEQLTPDEVYRIANCLFEQLPDEVRDTERSQLDRLGALADSWFAQQQRRGPLLRGMLR